MEQVVAVRAVGLNFRDVLNVLGMYPGDPGDPGVYVCEHCLLSASFNYYLFHLSGGIQNELVEISAPAICWKESFGR